MSAPADEIRMYVSALLLDPESKVPIVLLRDEAREFLLPIWIGVFEANAIAMTIEGVEAPRPMTHDLLLGSIRGLGGEIVRIVITELKDSTFFSRIHVRQDGRALEIDARPSDAIALALRAEAPFFATRAVLESASSDDRLSRLSQEERLRKWLEDASPDDLGKYKM